MEKKSAATSAGIIKNDGFGEDSELALPNRSVSAGGLLCFIATVP